MAMDPYNPYNYPNKPENKTTRHFCTCLACGKKWTHDYELTFRSWAAVAIGPQGFYYKPTFYYVHQYLLDKCPSCSGVIAHKILEGKYRENVPCDRRCTHATGNKCECSCGGKNHGAANLQ